jgi:hypothetical protein
LGTPRAALTSGQHGRRRQQSCIDEAFQQNGVTEHVCGEDRRHPVGRARHRGGTASATSVEQDRVQRLVNGGQRGTHRAQVGSVDDQDLEDPPVCDALQVGLRRLGFGLVAAGQIDAVDVGAKRQLPHDVLAEPGVGAGDEERIVWQRI